MYKVKAEAVDGLRVFANGKWLTCIGNRNVNVGDRVWTDGRCVYGFDRETTQPMVILSPPKIKTGIPIIMYNTAEKKFYCYTFAENTLITIKNFDDYNYRGLMTNNKYDKIFWSNNQSIVAINCDSAGNVYAIKTNFNEKKIFIEKNNEPVHTIDISPLEKTALESVVELLPNKSFTYSAFVLSVVNWAFIENENDWAFTIIIKANAECLTDEIINRLYEDWSNRQKEIQLDFQTFVDNHPYLSHFFEIGYSADSEYTYYITPQNSQLIFHWVADSEFADDPVSLIRHNYRVQESEFEKAKDFNFPVHDECYFKYENMYFMPGILRVPYLTQRAIYNADGEIIFRGYFFTDTYITVQKITATKYLIGVGEDRSAYGRIDLNPKSDSSPDYVKSGLYICENGNLNRFEEFAYKENSSLHYCVNQCLRSMKDFKHWTDYIQPLNQS